jgi:hypothetical protein
MLNERSPRRPRPTQDRWAEIARLARVQARALAQRGELTHPAWKIEAEIPATRPHRPAETHCWGGRLSGGPVQRPFPRVPDVSIGPRR